MDCLPKTEGNNTKVFWRKYRVLSRAPQASASFAWVIIILNTSTHSSLFQHRALRPLFLKVSELSLAAIYFLNYLHACSCQEPCFRFHRGYWIGMVHLKTEMNTSNSCLVQNGKLHNTCELTGRLTVSVVKLHLRTVFAKPVPDFLWCHYRVLHNKIKH